jgi:hypothetical protein
VFFASKTGDNAMSDDKKATDLSEYKRKKWERGALSRACASIEKARNHSAIAEDRFLSAWKQGIKKVGVECFTIKSDNIDLATDKWELAPNFEFIKENFAGYSHGIQVLLSLMYSFYDAEEGQKLLEQCKTPNLVDAQVVLDLEGREIVAALWSNHTGW